ncbi:MAG: LysR family transcriptional regulator [Burkholderiales bacterium]|nr:LysR family transcriptional regulator [Burkholderiales bacterium]
MDRLTAMRVFVEVADSGSQTAAADRLEMSRAMVSRYLAEMESWLGARLFQRTTRRLSLTDAGEACLMRSRAVLEQVGDLECNAGRSNAEPRGLIRVTAAMSFGQYHLAGAIADYVERYPQTQVDLLMVDRTVNLVEERVDLAVRITSELDPSLVARRLGPCRSVLCATPAYLARRGTPTRPEDLLAHNCLSYAQFGKGSWPLTYRGQPLPTAVQGNITANEASVLLKATLADAGISMQPTYLAAPLLRAGALVALLPDFPPAEMGIYGVYTSRRFIPPTLRTLLDFLAERLGPEPYWDRPSVGDETSVRRGAGSGKGSYAS